MTILTPAQEKYQRRLGIEETAKKSACGICGTQLEVNHDGQDWNIYCPKCRTFDGALMPIKGNRQTIWRLQQMASPERLEVERELKGERDMTQALGPVRSQALAHYMRRDVVITEASAQQIVTTIWPDAMMEAPAVVARAIILCHQYNLNPALKDLAIVPYWNKEKGKNDWEILLQIEANRKMAQSIAWYEYLDETPHMMSADDEIKFFGAVDKTQARSITRLKGKDGRVYVGAGQCALNASIKGADKGNSTANMSQIRSERRALKRLCPDLPDDVQVIDAAYMTDVVVSDETPAEPSEAELRELGAEAEAEAEADSAAEVPEGSYTLPFPLETMLALGYRDETSSREQMAKNTDKWFHEMDWRRLNDAQRQTCIDKAEATLKAKLDAKAAKEE